MCTNVNECRIACFWLEVYFVHCRLNLRFWSNRQRHWTPGLLFEGTKKDNWWVMFYCQMVVQTTVTATDHVICSVTRGSADVETSGRAATVTFPWKSTVKAVVTKTTVCIDITVRNTWQSRDNSPVADLVEHRERVPLRPLRIGLSPEINFL